MWRFPFDSQRLDGLSLDFTDVAEVYSTRQFTVRTEDGRIYVGVLEVLGDEVSVTGRSGGRLSRDALLPMQAKRVKAVVSGRPVTWSVMAGGPLRGG